MSMFQCDAMNTQDVMCVVVYFLSMLPWHMSDHDQITNHSNNRAANYYTAYHILVAVFYLCMHILQQDTLQIPVDLNCNLMCSPNFFR